MEDGEVDGDENRLEVDESIDIMEAEEGRAEVKVVKDDDTVVGPVLVRLLLLLTAAESSSWKDTKSAPTKV